MALLLLTIVIGLCAGIIMGMLGGGSGLALVPGISFILASATQISSTMIMHFAVGTTFAATLFFVLFTVYSQHKRQQVEWNLFFKLLPSLVIGTVIGNVAANHLPSHSLKIIFGIVILLLCIRILLQNDNQVIAKPWPGKTTVFTAGSFFGIVLGALGIAPFIVPFLRRYGVSMHKAIGTSTVCGLLFAFVGSITAILSGYHDTAFIPHALGYIYLPLILPLAISCLIAAEIGVRLAHKMSGNLLRKCYCLLLFVVGIIMLSC